MFGKKKKDKLAQEEKERIARENEAKREAEAKVALAERYKKAVEYDRRVAQGEDPELVEKEVYGQPDTPVEDEVEETRVDEPVEDEAEEAPVEEPAEDEAEETPVEEAAEDEAEETPVEEPVEDETEETPVEEPAEDEAEETPVEEPVEDEVEETRVDEPTEDEAEEAPVEEPAEDEAEETPVEEPVEEEAEETRVEEPTEDEVEETRDDEPTEELVEETPVEEPAEEPVKKAPAKKPTKKAPAKKAPAKKPAQKKEEVKPAEPEVVKEEAPVEEPVKNETPKKAAVKKAPAKKASKKVEEDTENEKILVEADPNDKTNGKYEIFQEAGGYKYKLVASNGQDLITSEVYTTAKGAQNGISTLKNNLDSLMIHVETDKHRKSQFVCATAQNKLLCSSANYSSKSAAESAIESFKNFAQATKIVLLKDEDETKPELVDRNLFKKAAGKGKYVILFNQQGLSYQFALKASNGQPVVTSKAYKSDTSVKSAITKFKKDVKEGTFYVVRDKNGMYEFRLYNSSNKLVQSGIAFDTKAKCLSNIESVIRFADSDLETK